MPTGSDMEALGQSEAFIEFQEQLSRVAPVERPVLVVGERGTGKELAATRLHYLSQRWQGPLVALNCAALTPNLVESELFGYERGAFTGAERRRTGRFEAAAGGTLFLDELGTVPLEVQEKILRVVEYGVFERVGGSRPVEVDVRLVAATNADLKGMAAEGRFKADLLDRLSFEVLQLPPLRRRTGDITYLAQYFAHRMTVELGRRPAPTLGRGALAALEAYHWPGNIRELKNVVERAVYRCTGRVVSEVIFDPFHSRDAVGGQPSVAAPAPQPEVEKQPSKVGTGDDLLGMPFKTAIVTLEVRLLKQALRDAHYNQRKAAERLGLTYDQFRGVKRKHAAQLD